MGTARERAIDVLRELSDRTWSRSACAEVVDAIIEAAREPSSSYSRELSEKRTEEDRRPEDITAAQRKALNDPRV